MTETIFREKMFLNEYVKTMIREKLGTSYIVKDNYIEKTFPNYPYPKRVGHFFIKDDDLYIVLQEYENTK